MKQSSESPVKPVGLTQSTGWQIGVRRTMTVSRSRAWELLLSAEGLAVWLGDMNKLDLTVGRTYETADGSTGQIRVVRPEVQIRMTWKPAAWDEPSTIQIRLLPTKNPDRTTISFHQENLSNGLIREEMKERWERACAWIEGAV